MCNTHRIVVFLMEPDAFLMSLLNRGKINMLSFKFNSPFPGLGNKGNRESNYVH